MKSGQAAGDGYVQFDKDSDMKDALNRHMEKIGHRYYSVEVKSTFFLFVSINFMFIYFLCLLSMFTFYSLSIYTDVLQILSFNFIGLNYLNLMKVLYCVL